MPLKAGFSIDQETLQDQRWKPRVELKDAVGHFAVIALRPDDPYFFARDVPNDVIRVAVAREYWKEGAVYRKLVEENGPAEPVAAQMPDMSRITSFFHFYPRKLETVPGTILK